MRSDVAYDDTFDPPAPVLPALLSAPGGSRGALLPMLLDTGADCTVVPLQVARALGLPAVGQLALRGVTGTAVQVPVFAASIRIGRSERIARVVGFGGEAILGRDVLATLVARLDGPRGSFRLSLGRR